METKDQPDTQARASAPNQSAEGNKEQKFQPPWDVWLAVVAWPVGVGLILITLSLWDAGKGWRDLWGPEPATPAALGGPKEVVVAPPGLPKPPPTRPVEATPQELHPEEGASDIPASGVDPDDASTPEAGDASGAEASEGSEPDEVHDAAASLLATEKFGALPASAQEVDPEALKKALGAVGEDAIKGHGTPEIIFMRLGLIIVCFGALGGALFGVRGLIKHSVEGNFQPRYRASYYLHPMAGGLCGFVSFFMVLGGMMSVQGSGSTLAWSSLDGRIAFFAVALLAGYASDTFSGKLKELAETLFARRSSEKEEPPFTPTDSKGLDKKSKNP